MSPEYVDTGCGDSHFCGVPLEDRVGGFGGDDLAGGHGREALA